MDLIRQDLIDAGCNTKDIDEINRYVRQDMHNELLHTLKKKRCIFLEEMHQSEKRSIV